MKKKILSTIAIAMFTVNASGYTKNESPSSGSLSIAWSGLAMDYREYDRNLGQILDSEESMPNEMMGVEMKLNLTPLSTKENINHFNIEGLIISGKTLYIGSYLVSSEGYGSLIEHTKNRIIRGRAGYQYEHKAFDLISLVFGGSVGYYEWERELSKYQLETYKWYPIEGRVGLGIDTKGFSLHGYYSRTYGHKPEMLLKSTGMVDMKFKLGGVYIEEISFPLVVKINEYVGIYSETVFQKQKIVESDIVSTYYEPKSTTKNFYTKLGLIFNF